MHRITQLLAAARALSPEVEVRFRGTPNEDLWVCVVTVGPVVLFESPAGSIEEVIEGAVHKLKGMSQKMRAILVSNEGSSPDSEGSSDT
jgi:hypothetical protein